MANERTLHHQNRASENLGQTYLKKKKNYWKYLDEIEINILLFSSLLSSSLQILKKFLSQFPPRNSPKKSSNQNRLRKVTSLKFIWILLTTELFYFPLSQVERMTVKPISQEEITDIIASQIHTSQWRYSLSLSSPLLFRSFSLFP